MMGRIGRAFTAIALAALRLYRATLSYAFGPCCRFHPSCSAYAEEALRVHGALRGSWLAVGRLLRCNPLCAGGLDPVPPARRRVARAIEPAGTRAGG